MVWNTFKVGLPLLQRRLRRSADAARSAWSEEIFTPETWANHWLSWTITDALAGLPDSVLPLVPEDVAHYIRAAKGLHPVTADTAARRGLRTPQIDWSEKPGVSDYTDDYLYSWAITSAMAGLSDSVLRQVPTDIEEAIRGAKALHPEIADGAVRRDQQVFARSAHRCASGSTPCTAASNIQREQLVFPVLFEAERS